LGGGAYATPCIALAEFARPPKNLENPLKKVGPPKNLENPLKKVGPLKCNNMTPNAF
jgi:hypothetical protein